MGGKRENGMEDIIPAEETSRISVFSEGTENPSSTLLSEAAEAGVGVSGRGISAASLSFSREDGVLGMGVSGRGTLLAGLGVEIAVGVGVEGRGICDGVMGLEAEAVAVAAAGVDGRGICDGVIGLRTLSAATAVVTRRVSILWIEMEVEILGRQHTRARLGGTWSIHNCGLIAVMFMSE